MLLALGYFALVAMSSAVALGDWRRAVYLGILLDVIRDPIRKLTPGHPVYITLAVGGVWLLAFLGMFLRNESSIQAFRRAYPQCRKAFYLLLLGLIPAALISLACYSKGYILIAMGGLSYTFPAIAILLGFVFARRERDLVYFAGWYSIINAVFLTGALLEFQKLPVPALGGIDMTWIRYRTGYILDLICGFYRSPDLLGLHAAHVMMFSSILTVRKNARFRWLWIALACFAGVCLILSGRRKMIVMPVVFAMVILYGVARQRRLHRLLQVAVVLLLIAIGIWSILPSGVEDHMVFATSTLDEGFQRINPVDKVYWTLYQSGILGYGLGTATQGNYQFVDHGQRTWQEDGVGRLAAELGLPGMLVVLIAVWMLGREVVQALGRGKTNPLNHLLQYALLGAFLANIASFLASHQAYSGDPSSIAIACCCLGFVLAMPHWNTLQARAVRCRGDAAAVSWQDFPMVNGWNGAVSWESHRSTESGSPNTDCEETSSPR
jgi:hypothetical protein